MLAARLSPLGAAAAVSLVLAVLPGCAARQARQDAPTHRGILPCAVADSAAPDGDLLAPGALQCWLRAPHGRWRILSHESHYNALVVEIETADVRDAEGIAQRFVAGARERYVEILVYAHPAAASGRIRRVRWARDEGFQILEIRIERGG